MNTSSMNPKTPITLSGSISNGNMRQNTTRNNSLIKYIFLMKNIRKFMLKMNLTNRLNMQGNQSILRISGRLSSNRRLQSFILVDIYMPRQVGTLQWKHLNRTLMSLRQSGHFTLVRGLRSQSQKMQPAQKEWPQVDEVYSYLGQAKHIEHVVSFLYLRTSYRSCGYSRGTSRLAS